MSKKTNNEESQSVSPKPLPLGGASCSSSVIHLERYRSTMGAEVLHSWAKEAQELIDKLMSDRQEWRCVVGNETFITDDKSVADEWREGGHDVERYFVKTNEKEHAPSPAGARAETSETEQSTGKPENRAAGDGCVSRLVRCSDSETKPRPWEAPDYEKKLTLDRLRGIERIAEKRIKGAQILRRLLADVSSEECECIKAILD